MTDHYNSVLEITVPFLEYINCNQTFILDSYTDPSFAVSLQILAFWPQALNEMDTPHRSIALLRAWPSQASKTAEMVFSQCTFQKKKTSTVEHEVNTSRTILNLTYLKSRWIGLLIFSSLILLRNNFY